MKLLVPPTTTLNSQFSLMGRAAIKFQSNNSYEYFQFANSCDNNEMKETNSLTLQQITDTGL